MELRCTTTRSTCMRNSLGCEKHDRTQGAQERKEDTPHKVFGLCAISFPGFRCLFSRAGERMLKQRPGDHLATARLSFAKATQVVWCGAVAREAPSCGVSVDLKFDTMFSDTSLGQQFSSEVEKRVHLRRYILGDRLGSAPIYDHFRRQCNDVRCCESRLCRCQRCTWVVCLVRFGPRIQCCV